MFSNISTYIILKILCFFAILTVISTKYVCPKQCICDISNSLKRARCERHNIIDIDIEVFKGVEDYSLRGNLIEKLEDNSFKNIEYTSLIKLDLSDNGIFWMGLYAFSGLDNLKYLNLSKNRLQGFPKDILWDSKKLETLDISKNKFHNLANYTFISHSNLKVLDLSDSQIPYLPENVFDNLPKLIKLDLSKNYMIKLQIGVLKPLTNLKFLNLNDNHWLCNLQFNEVQGWILKNGIDYKTQCRKLENKFEKMLLKPSEHLYESHESQNQDLDELWDIEEKAENFNNETFEIPPNTFIHNFNTRFPSLWSLGIGFMLGFLVGILLTYCWIAICSCGKISLKSRREIERERRRFNDNANNLLLSSGLGIQLDTPPIQRRQPSDGTSSRSLSWEARPISNDRPILRNRTENTQSNAVNRNASRETPLLISFTPTPRPRLNHTTGNVDVTFRRNPETPLPLETSVSREIASLLTFTPTPRPRMSHIGPRETGSARVQAESPPPTYKDCIHDSIILNYENI